MTIRINSWSGPRNVSTALMRSFAQRGDAVAIDEPLYGYYLATTGAPHPGRDELVEILETSASKIVDEVILGPCDREILFLKQMVHHLTPELDLAFLEDCVNILLIRDPAQVIASLVHQLPEPTMRDVGLKRQVELFKSLRLQGQDPPVVDAKQLLLDPEGVLETLCGHLGIDWDPAMLSWPPGPQPEDGPWSKYWYDNVQQSTGFAPYRERTSEVPESCNELLAECRDLYDELISYTIVARREEVS